VLGAGWSQLSTMPAPMAIAILLQFGAEEAEGEHHFELFLTDSDHQPVFADPTNPATAIEVRGDASVALPPEFDWRLPVPWPIAVNVPGLVLPAGEAFQWNLIVDGETQPDWTLRFRTAPNP